MTGKAEDKSPTLPETKDKVAKTAVVAGAGVGAAVGTAVVGAATTAVATASAATAASVAASAASVGGSVLAGTIFAPLATVAGASTVSAPLVAVLVANPTGWISRKPGSSPRPKPSRYSTRRSRAPRNKTNQRKD